LLTEEQAKEIYRQGEEAVVFALLTLAQQSAPPTPSISPSMPSAMVRLSSVHRTAEKVLYLQ
jgi:hypothetical protein